MDLWVFDIYLSNGSLSLETIIIKVDVDLWIFEIQYNKTQRNQSQTLGICGFFYVDLSCVIALVAQNDVDLWIFETMNINVQKVKVTVLKML